MTSADLARSISVDTLWPTALFGLSALFIALGTALPGPIGLALLLAYLGGLSIRGWRAQHAWLSRGGNDDLTRVPVEQRLALAHLVRVELSLSRLSRTAALILVLPALASTAGLTGPMTTDLLSLVPLGLAFWLVAVVALRHSALEAYLPQMAKVEPLR